jgi:tetratricopeptide (TPR) repeat protein/predicted ATPase
MRDPLFTEIDRLREANNGVQYGSHTGDGMMIVFQHAQDAVQFACDLQLSLQNDPIAAQDNTGNTHKVVLRVGIHTAEQQMVPTNGRYPSHIEITYAARYMSIAQREQIILSESAKRAIDDKQYQWQEWTNRRIKNREEQPQSVWELLYDGQRREEPGIQFLPEWYVERNRYVPRDNKEKEILDTLGTRGQNRQLYRFVTLHGYGGTGKTRLAIQCGINSIAVFEGNVVFVGLEDVPLTATDDAGQKQRAALLAERIGIAFKISGEQALPENLPTNLPDKPLLLLLDNYESVHGRESARLLKKIHDAKPELCFLITSRQTVGLETIERVVRVEGLEPKEARALLLERVRAKLGIDWNPNTDDEKAIEEILRLTERIALAIELVAAWAAVDSLTVIAQGLAQEELGEHSRLPEDAFLGEDTDRHEGLERSLNWSFDRLAELGQKLFPLLGLFADSFAKTRLPDALQEDSRAVRDGLIHLKNAALITLHTQGDLADRGTMLRPTRIYAKQKFQAMPEATKEAKYTAFTTYYRDIVTEHAGNEALYHADGKAKAALDREWRNIAGAAQLACEKPDAESAEEIANRLIHYLHGNALYADGIALLSTVLECQRKALPLGHPDIATSLNNLALLLVSTGRYVEAEPLYREALAMRQEALPLGHPDIATSLNNLALLLVSTGRYVEAERLYREALAMRQEALPLGHPDIATSLNNLAGLLESTGRYVEAERLFREALAMRQEALPLGHPSIATSLNNLAGLLRSTGRYVEAEPLYREALAMRQEALPLGHPDIATSLNNLAGLLESTGRYGEAERLYREALAIYREALGESHPSTQTVQQNVMLFQFEKDLVEAQEAGLVEHLALPRLRELSPQERKKIVMEILQKIIESQQQGSE